MVHMPLPARTQQRTREQTKHKDIWYANRMNKQMYSESLNDNNNNQPIYIEGPIVGGEREASSHWWLLEPKTRSNIYIPPKTLNPKTLTLKP